MSYRCKDGKHDFKQLKSSFFVLLFCRKCATLVDVGKQHASMKAEQQQGLDRAMRDTGPAVHRSDPRFVGAAMGAEGANA